MNGDKITIFPWLKFLDFAMCYLHSRNPFLQNLLYGGHPYPDMATAARCAARRLLEGCVVTIPVFETSFTFSPMSASQAALTPTLLGIFEVFYPAAAAAMAQQNGHPPSQTLSRLRSSTPLVLQASILLLWQLLVHSK